MKSVEHPFSKVPTDLDMMKPNEQADRLTSKATVTSGLHLRFDLVRRLKHNVWAEGAKANDITPLVGWRREEKGSG